MKTMFGFEYHVHRTAENHDCGRKDGCYWSAEHCGHQGPDNYFATEEEATAELPHLARVMDNCDVTDLRVVAVKITEKK